ncbi:basic proline-rich protein-like [Onychostruthus taczanowskii]|uniref:basic proline-rich protein-like n=1 Tax=Onychostruthus taczanowskii TaxID=356909 RepID=UPI001B802951|nr:basic proline-rich protein-like [Onychostruthus taczanowskii]
MQLLETERARRAALKWLLTQPKHAAQESRGAEPSRTRSRSRGRARARGPRLRAHTRRGAAPQRGLGLRQVRAPPPRALPAPRAPGTEPAAHLARPPSRALPHRSVPSGAPRRGALGGERAESRAAPGAWEAVRPRPGMPEPRRTRAGSRRLRGSATASPLAPSRPPPAQEPRAGCCHLPAAPRSPRPLPPSRLPPAGRDSSGDVQRGTARRRRRGTAPSSAAAARTCGV